jgi:hypothetical protein
VDGQREQGIFFRGLRSLQSRHGLQQLASGLLREALEISLELTLCPHCSTIRNNDVAVICRRGHLEARVPGLTTRLT